ncbi:hypothetical protein CTEN210_12807 [Chaetoceros tenuissimus]|uniref:Uncharacterized protein n=1 Tax=Chaetoceros tenuissimus TaxID=426638 RepID=A0AAD3D3Z8_9STRA|nr:hypothetical protein CTEN210_12807 [Chaetoceros tenuissimus]
MLNNQVKAALDNNGFSKIMCPFGILVFADADYSDDWLRYLSNVIASLVDTDGDGIADNDEVVKALAHEGNMGAGMRCGSTREQEDQEQKFYGIMDFTYSCQFYNDGDWNANGKNTLFEEAFHMYHQYGLASVWPTVFGYNPDDPLNDYEYSLVCRETASHQCVSPGWLHSENNCPNGAPFSPGNPADSPLSGTCNYPSCDCNEFFLQAYTKYIGLPYLLYSEYFPENRDTFMNMISPDFKNMLSDPQYSLRQSPPPDAYLVPNVIGTCTDSYVCCDDFPDKIKWKIKGVMSTLYCSDMTEYRCKKKKGKSLCPNECGTTATWCNKDAKGQVEFGTNENGDTIFKGCPFVKRVPEKIVQRCSKGNIAMACRETCKDYS